jgi:Tol biopolymer transport system component
MRKKAFIVFLLSICLASSQGIGESSEQNSSLEKIPGPKMAVEGRIIFQSNFDGDAEICMISNNKVIKLTDNDWEDQFPVWSPDGKKIAFSANPDGQFDIYIMDDSGDGIVAVTSFPTDEATPAWYPDGKRIAFTRYIKQFAGKKENLYSVDIQTGSTEKIIPRFDRKHAIPHFSPRPPLMTLTVKRMLGWDVAVYDLKSHEITNIEEGGKSCRARFSKDGKKLAYVSTKEGKGDIWSMRPDGSQKTRLTYRDQTHDYFPSWSPDGRHIIFCSSLQHEMDSDWQIYVYDLKEKKAMLLFDSPGSDIFPDWHQ